jgi:hypothetical protein
MHVLIASAIGLAAVLLPSAALAVLRGWVRQQRALCRATQPSEHDGAPT